MGFDASPLVMVRRRRSFIEKIDVRNAAYYCTRRDL